ncbi:MAG TPA: Fur family transcriptional regulator [Azospirillaceae bacterium]|nr:Fur family transcriptional regulator [Azospirillaceae bacterium]
MSGDDDHDHHPHAHDPHHDHGACVQDALRRAEAQCARSGARLTPLRRRVLELVWSNHKPHGAYALLEALERESDRKIAPLTVYRALDFLVEQGLAHRIESLNAYVGCSAPGDGHSAQFLVCERCGCAQEIDDAAISAAVGDSAAARGFAVRRKTIEISGVCRICQELPR